MIRWFGSSSNANVKTKAQRDFRTIFRRQNGKIGCCLETVSGKFGPNKHVM